MSETSLNLCEGGSVIRISIPGIHHYLINVRRAAIRCIHSVASLYVLCDIIDRLLGEEEEGEGGRRRRRRDLKSSGEGSRAVKLTMRGYGTLPYEYISHNSIPKLHTSDLLENFYTHTHKKNEIKTTCSHTGQEHCSVINRQVEHF